MHRPNIQDAAGTISVMAAELQKATTWCQSQLAMLQPTCMGKGEHLSRPTHTASWHSAAPLHAAPAESLTASTIQNFMCTASNLTAMHELLYTSATWALRASASSTCIMHTAERHISLRIAGGPSHTGNEVCAERQHTLQQMSKKVLARE